MNMILRALMVSVWFMALTFPLVVLKVDALNDTILFRWENMASIGVGAFVLSIFWRWSMERKARGAVSTGPSLFARALEAVRQPKPRYTCLGLIAVLMLVMPYISSMYQINIMISALIYIMLGLGLNIVVGLAGQLVLGYAAFYAVGAYTYGLLNTYFGLGFWAVLPVGGIMAALFGLMLGFPVLRLKGDYLAIVTLGFGEIIRLVLENWTSVTKGSFGLSNLSRPSLFGMEMGVTEATNYIYYIVLAAVVVTIIVVGRLKNSRIGLALQALREDEIACEAMGIDLTKVKLSAFALGSCWAGFAGISRPFSRAAPESLRPRPRSSTPPASLSWNRPWSCPWGCSAAWVPCSASPSRRPSWCSRPNTCAHSPSTVCSCSARSWSS